MFTTISPGFISPDNMTPLLSELLSILPHQLLVTLVMVCGERNLYPGVSTAVNLASMSIPNLILSQAPFQNWPRNKLKGSYTTSLTREAIKGFEIHNFYAVKIWSTSSSALFDPILSLQDWVALSLGRSEILKRFYIAWDLDKCINFVSFVWN